MAAMLFVVFVLLGGGAVVYLLKSRKELREFADAGENVDK